MTDERSKKCSMCKKVLNVCCFYKNKRSPDGINTYCKPCNLSYQRAYASKNKEHVAEVKDRDSVIKMCFRCKLSKSGRMFSLSEGKRDGLSSECKPCTSKSRVQRRKNYIKKVLDLKGSECRVCSRKCSEDSFHLFDLHHVIPSEKVNQIKHTLSKKKLDIELPKTVLLCALCHRHHHHLERNDESYIPVFYGKTDGRWRTARSVEVLGFAKGNVPEKRSASGGARSK